MLHEVYFHQVKVKTSTESVCYIYDLIPTGKLDSYKNSRIVHILTYAAFSNNACTEAT